MDRKEHWERVHSTKQEREVSWFQAEPTRSLSWIRTLASPCDRIIDVGCGSSTLVDRLLDANYQHVAALDISRAALERTRRRLGARADRVRWIEADVAVVDALGEFDVWHDRAVFHFLTEDAERRRYVELASRSVVPGGHLVMATFAPEGPNRCSGLEIRRYDARSLAEEFGPAFAAVGDEAERHETPWGATQEFLIAAFRRVGEPRAL